MTDEVAIHIEIGKKFLAALLEIEREASLAKFGSRYKALSRICDITKEAQYRALGCIPRAKA